MPPPTWWLGYIRLADGYWRPVASAPTLPGCWAALLHFPGGGPRLCIPSQSGFLRPVAEDGRGSEDNDMCGGVTTEQDMRDDQTGTRQKQPLQGQAVLYFGPNVQAFIDRFAAFGLCVAILWRTGP